MLFSYITPMRNIAERQRRNEEFSQHNERTEVKKQEIHKNAGIGEGAGRQNVIEWQRYAGGVREAEREERGDDTGAETEQAGRRGWHGRAGIIVSDTHDRQTGMLQPRKCMG